MVRPLGSLAIFSSSMSISNHNASMYTFRAIISLSQLFLWFNTDLKTLWPNGLADFHAISNEVAFSCEVDCEFQCHFAI